MSKPSQPALSDAHVDKKRCCCFIGDHKDFRDLQAAFCVVKLGDLTKNTTRDFLHVLHTVCVFR